MRQAMFILWPSFIVGGIGEVLFFTAFDPKELYLFGEPTSLSRLAVTPSGFFYAGHSRRLRARSPVSCSAAPGR